MQQKLAQKEKESKEENLRYLPSVHGKNVEALLLNNGTEPSGAQVVFGCLWQRRRYESEASYDSAEDEDARKIRDQMRQDKRREREREMRMSNMGQEQRAKQLARQQNPTSQRKLLLDWRTNPIKRIDARLTFIQSRIIIW